MNLDHLFPAEKLANEGVWVKFLDDPPVSLKIASRSSSNRIWHAGRFADYARMSSLTENKDKLAEKEITDSELETIAKLGDEAIKSSAITLLKDWKGVEEKGKPVKYTPEAGYDLMRRYPDIHTFVVEFAKNTDNFLIPKDDEAKKKS